MTLPLVREVTGLLPEDALQRLSTLPHCLYLDSARSVPKLGRYSFLMADPVRVLRGHAADGNRLSELANELQSFNTDTVPGLPPFQGGAAGLWSYEMARWLEQVPAHGTNEFQLPALHVGIYDVVLAFDLSQQRSWLISQGFPEQDLTARTARATSRLEQFLRYLQQPVTKTNLPPQPALDLSRAFPTEVPGVTSNLSRTAYLATVQRAIDYIHAGDLFQVNLAQRLTHPATCDAVTLYLRLRERNPAPFAAYFDIGSHQIISASPERFLQVKDRVVEARPIKGTRQRTVARPEADLFAGAELRASAKDLAENVMIVDLMRNDLSRVCDDDSVCVTQLCELETYEYVQHLVSVVRGKLRHDVTTIDLLQAAFPGGSITGAPKVRAMEIIAELEPTARGAYCGSLGYIGFDGGMDSNILIRTITASHGWWQFPVGGGIVADSEPEKEFAETWHKASGMLKAILNP